VESVEGKRIRRQISIELSFYGLLFQKMASKNDETLTGKGFKCEPDWITCGDPSTPARSLPRSFALLRSARLFHLFAFECKHSTLINKKSSSASLKRICEPDWIRTNGLLLRSLQTNFYDS
jgi:hypothetical protein